MSDAAPSLVTRYGFARTGDPVAPLIVTPYPEVCVHDTLRATVVASAADLVGGFAAREIAGTDATFTMDLSVRIPHPGRPARLVAHAEPLRAGRRFVTTGMRLAAGTETFAWGETTFTRLPRPDGHAVPEALETPTDLPFRPLTRPLDQEVGVETDPAVPGRVLLPLGAPHRNPEGAVQGAIVALLAECAALSLAGGRAVVTGLDLRYLRAASRGPVEARASWLGDPARGALRVVQRDLARPERPTASALVAVGPTPT